MRALTLLRCFGTAGQASSGTLRYLFCDELAMTNQIEKLKQDYTDRYVVVDADVPELKRFEGYVGQVKTVNMSGRALVQFEAWSNIGWYDIEPDYLRIVPKPEAAEKKEAKHAAPAKAPAAPAKAAAAAPAGEKKLSPLEMARMQGAAKPAGEKTAPAAKPAPAAAGARNRRPTFWPPPAPPRPPPLAPRPPRVLRPPSRS